MANLGPLTTTYTAISSISCESVHLATDTEGFWLEQANEFEDCFPPNFTALEGYYYSPGVCQNGYTYACTTTTGGPGTTLATCCPSGFTCRSTRSDGDNDACQSILRSDSPYIGNVITYHGGRSKDIGTTTTLIEAGEIVYAIGVPVRRAATDAEWTIASTNLDITATQTKTPTISTESTPESSGSVRPTTETITLETQDPGSPSSGTATQTGLGTAARAAIGVGTVLGVLVFLLGTAAIYHVGKRKGRTPTSASSTQESVDTERKLSGPRLGHELEEQRGIHEMNANREPSELTAVMEPVELN
ncbi:hypothetical protein F4680DRAFT_164430 [Xylaria scruposa]|nr:hypothetical protein F4680DRAFT_164430 [Xylaria scruposa]